MSFRFARVDDAAALTRIHLDAVRQLEGSFMDRLGAAFLRQYYRVFAAEPSSLILCGLDDRGEIVGFVAGTMAAEEHRRHLSKHKWRLGLAMIPGLVRRPRLLLDAYRRYRSGSADADEDAFVVSAGPRSELWVWDAARGKPGGGLPLYLAWLKICRTLGAERVRFEVDVDNDRASGIHERLGAVVIREFLTPDGRRRQIREYDLAARERM